MFIKIGELIFNAQNICALEQESNKTIVFLLGGIQLSTPQSMKTFLEHLQKLQLKYVMINDNEAVVLDHVVGFSDYSETEMAIAYVDGETYYYETDKSVADVMGSVPTYLSTDEVEEIDDLPQRQPTSSFSLKSLIIVGVVIAAALALYNLS